MATSTQSLIFRNSTYVDDIKNQIINSGGTIVFMKDNIIVASEISESQYRELLKSPYIDKLDVLPLKRYADTGIKYTEAENTSNFQTNTISENISINTATDI